MDDFGIFHYASIAQTSSCKLFIKHDKMQEAIWIPSDTESENSSISDNHDYEDHDASQVEELAADADDTQSVNSFPSLHTFLTSLTPGSSLNCIGE